MVLGGAALYIIGAYLAIISDGLDQLLLARMLQGLGAAGPRIAALAIIRDRYAGRGMAQVMSFVMMVFTIVPALAPSIGAGLIWLSGWRAVFWGFMVFAGFASLWLILRMPETLDRANRRPFRFSEIKSALVEMMGYPMVRLSIIVQSFSE